VEHCADAFGDTFALQRDVARETLGLVLRVSQASQRSVEPSGIDCFRLSAPVLEPYED